MQGCLTKLRILFHCLLDGGQFILSRGWDGGLSGAINKDVDALGQFELPPVK